MFRSVQRLARRFSSFPVEHEVVTAAPAKTASSSLLPTAAAAVAGIGTVSLAAYVAEQMAPVPSFVPGGSRFDTSTYTGRALSMLLQCDPRLLLFTTKEVRELQASLKKAEGDDRAKWEAQRVVQAAIHPDTDEVLPRPFRMSG